MLPPPKLVMPAEVQALKPATTKQVINSVRIDFIIYDLLVKLRIPRHSATDSTVILPPIP
jgi:hypothetical protein